MNDPSIPATRINGMRVNPGASSTYAGGPNPITTMAEISKKQFEFDFQIKRITISANSLKEDFKGTDKKLS
jgi:hypothetical protein